MSVFRAAALSFIAIILASCSKEPDPKIAERNAIFAKGVTNATERLKVLEQAKSEGRLIDKLTISASANETAIEITIHNGSEFALKHIDFEVSDSERWTKYMNERQNGVAVHEMPTKMRPDWLKATGYFETKERIRSETHLRVVHSGLMLAGEGTAISKPLPPGFKKSRALKVNIESVQDVSDRPWTSSWAIFLTRDNLSMYERLLANPNAQDRAR